jgi:hypothetical protein
MGQPRTKPKPGFDERYESVSYDPELPDVIKLPDGREFNVTELMAQSRQNARSGHIKTFLKNPTGEYKKPGRFNNKYSEEDRAWFLKATPEEVQERFKIDRNSALAKLRYIHNMLGMKYKVPERKPDRRTAPK